MSDWNAQVLEAFMIRFHKLDNNHPKFYTRACQITKNAFRIIYGENHEKVLKITELQNSLPPFNIPLSSVENTAFALKMQGKLNARVLINGEMYSIHQIDEHLENLYELLMFLLAKAYYSKEEQHYGIKLEEDQK